MHVIEFLCHVWCLVRQMHHIWSWWIADLLDLSDVLLICGRRTIIVFLFFFLSSILLSLLLELNFILTGSVLFCRKFVFLVWLLLYVYVNTVVFASVVDSKKTLCWHCMGNWNYRYCHVNVGLWYLCKLLVHPKNSSLFFVSFLHCEVYLF